MTTVRPGLFLLATALLLLAHAARATRWSYLLTGQLGRGRFTLLVGLTLGYLANALVPWRLGEVLRAVYVAVRARLRVPLVVASVIAERTSDLLVVGVMAALLAPVLEERDRALARLSLAMLLVVAVIIAAAAVLRGSAQARRVVWRGAGVFNDGLRLGIADGAWTLTELLAGRRLLTVPFMVSTGIMWALYWASYTTLSAAIGGDIGDTFLVLLGRPQQALFDRLARTSGLTVSLYVVAYTGIPIVGVLLYGAIRQGNGIVRWLRASRVYRLGQEDRASGVMRERFGSEAEYRYFLASMFSGDDRVAAQYGLRADDRAIVHRLFNGGSDAMTALVEVDGEFWIRKFAADAAAQRLREQADWLRTHRAPCLSLVPVAREVVGSGYHQYDMPYDVSASDFYEVIHTDGGERSRALLVSVIEGVHGLHERTRGPGATESSIRRYLDEKATRNAEVILRFARSVLPGRRYRVNGESYDLDEWVCLSEPTWLARQIEDRRTATIHGDLTIENIIISPSARRGWYLIDPNPANIFDSPLIDWAKLQQSLDLGYETLNRGPTCSLQGDDIRLLLAKSRAYADLEAVLACEREARLGPDALREVLFHQLVHYLRLTPYKIRRDPVKGLAFFACTSILLRRYRRDYE